MYWILISVIAFTIIYLFTRRVRLNLTPLLLVRIDSVDGFQFYARFTQLHTDLNSIEYVRLNLHFISKMLLLAKAEERSMIRSFLRTIAASESVEVGLRKYKEQVIVLGELDKFPNKSSSIMATLYYQNMPLRMISTKVPWNILEDHFFASIVALLTISIPKIDDYEKNILHKGIGNLNRLFYSHINDYSTKSVNLFPNNAFNEAVLKASN